MKLPPGHVPGSGVHKATAYGGFGQKMLEKMGWSRGQGLGKDKHGMKEAIEVKKKEDALGVGATASGWKWDWKYWEDAYNTGLQSLKKGGGKRSSRKRSRDSASETSSGSESDSAGSSSAGSSNDSSSNSDSDSSDEDEEHNARLAAALNRDGTATSASAAELKLALALAKDTAGGRSIGGRFGGRDGKMARIRQQEEQQAAAMRAKLGIPHPPAAGAAAPAAAADSASAAGGGGGKRKRKQADAAAGAAGSSGGSGSAPEGAGKHASSGSRGSGKQKKPKAGQQQRAASSSEASQQPQQPGPELEQAVAKRPRVVLVVDRAACGAAQRQAFEAFAPTPAAGWWGAKMFASAGLLEGLEQEAAQPEQQGNAQTQQPQRRQRQTFDEDLQAAVYMAAHGAQRQGKRGLGKSSTLKIAGGSWQGTKVSFAEEEPDGAQPAGSAAVAAAAAAGGAQEQPAGEDGPPAATPRARKKVRWVKLAVRQLQQAPGRKLKWKRLWPLLLAEAAAATQLLDAAACKAEAWARLNSCSRLHVAGKLVSLAA